MGKGRAPCCDKSKVKRGPWCPAEDLRLKSFIEKHGCTNWRALPKQAGLLRCGKSCRLRWINYLRPDVKRGNFTPEEEQTIINLHNSFGNKWSKIASCLPGRTDNEIKNVWNTHLKKKLSKKAIGSCQKTKADDSKTENSGSPSCSITAFEDQNTEKKEGQKTEADDSKTVNSGFPSCSITTFEDQNTEKKEGDGTVKESRIQKSYEKIESLLKFPHSSDGESKETGTSDSPISSHASNFSNSNRDPVSSVANQENGPDHGNGAIQFDSDIDFWELLDSLDPLQSSQTEENGVNVDFSLFNPADKFDSEVECNNWLRFLENELGLTSDNFPNDQEMNFEPEVCPAMDCSPIWNDLT